MSALLNEIVSEIPRSRIAGVLSRLRNGQSLRIAVLSEGLDPLDRSRLLDFAIELGDSTSPQFLAKAIDALYDGKSSIQIAADIVWTGPRVEGNFDYTPTIVAARRIVDGASRRIIVAGFRVTAGTLEALGAWSALARGVTIDVIVNNKDLAEVDYQIMVAKGIRVHRVAPDGHDFAKFHVKALISDGISALVGSANFTSFGQSTNIELGLHVVGAVATTIEAMLDQYVSTASSTGWIVTT